MFGDFPQSSCTKAHDQLAAYFLKALIGVEAPLPRSLDSGRSNAKHDVVMSLTPDAETLLEPSVEVPVVRSAPCSI